MLRSHARISRLVARYSGDSFLFTNGTSATRGCAIHHNGSSDAMDVYVTANRAWAYTLAFAVSNTAAVAVPNGSLRFATTWRRGRSTVRDTRRRRSSDGASNHLFEYSRLYLRNLLQHERERSHYGGSHRGRDGGDGFLRWVAVGNLNAWNSLHSSAVTLAQCLMWKAHGMGHVIFDASAGMAPNGAPSIPRTLTSDGLQRIQRLWDGTGAIRTASKWTWLDDAFTRITTDSEQTRFGRQ